MSSFHRGALLYFVVFLFVKNIPRYSFPKMAGSEPAEMNIPDEGPSTSRAKPVGKFDMHLHSSKLSQHTLDKFCIEYGIPSDLHPMVPPDGFTMNELPDSKIGIYIQQVKLGGLEFPSPPSF